MALHFLLDAAADADAGDIVSLTGAEAHHAASVRRVREGEQLTLGDGRGVWLTGEAEAVAAASVAVRITSRSFVPAPRPRLVLVQALAKGDRDELAVQAATELGVDEIVPWQASRSVSRWVGAKQGKGRARWASIVREAAKQSHRPWVPEVAAPASTGDVAARASTSTVLVLEPTASAPLSAVALDQVEELVLVVGPEGGIAPHELDDFAAAGARTVRLGETVLRTSTAGPAALAVAAVLLGRW